MGIYDDYKRKNRIGGLFDDSGNNKYEPYIPNKPYNPTTYGTDINFHRPSFLGGIGSTFGIKGNHGLSSYPCSNMDSLRNDWGTIGNDFNNSIGSFNPNRNPHVPNSDPPILPLISLNNKSKW